ncbi:unnamed protein product [marine sediment metagenome]|uniref:Uncharacterized protein n=1 Tax=marine sediment metagenome TaxID=412755 RepID=X1THW0_9ZZZZ
MLADSLHNTDLGKIKLVEKSSQVTLHNVKDYIITGKAKIKGIPKSAEKVSEDEFITHQQVGVRAGLRAKNVNTMTWRQVRKRLRRVYEKGVIKHWTEVYPLILDYDHDRNWLDYEAMLERYGEFATCHGKYIDDIMNPYSAGALADMSDLESRSPADRRQIEIDDLEARRSGEMIYQRGK